MIVIEQTKPHSIFYNERLEEMYCAEDISTKHLADETVHWKQVGRESISRDGGISLDDNRSRC